MQPTDAVASDIGAPATSAVTGTDVPLEVDSPTPELWRAEPRNGRCATSTPMTAVPEL